MGQKESLDIEEIKFICRQIIAGRTDSQIKGALLEDWGKRDVRTIRQIRRIFQASQEVLMENFSKTEKMAKGQLSDDISRAIDIVNHMARGLRPVYDEKTGKITYETWLEF
jgi:hypothetical protein